MIFNRKFNFSPENEEEFIKRYTPFMESLDLDENDEKQNDSNKQKFNFKFYKNLLIIFAFRYLTQLSSVHFMYHADENWQSLEIAYDLLYGTRSLKSSSSTAAVVEIIQSWEWSKIYGLRNHLYPFWLAIPGFFLKILRLDYNFAIVNSFYFMHCIVWVFGDVYFYRLANILGGKQLAIYSTMISLSNETSIRYISHTSMNGVETSLTIAALYYFLLLKPSIYCHNLMKMTFLITVTFLGRSSSLSVWIPLAILKIIENSEFFLPIIFAGVFITLPTIAFSIFLDSYYYGGFTIPQINFVRINVLLNLSKYFGVDPWYFYLTQLNNEFGTIFYLSLFGLFLFTVKQINGSLTNYNIEMTKRGIRKSRIPICMIYIVTYLFVLSIVDHKERRFYAPITQLASIFQAFAFTQLFIIVRYLHSIKENINASVVGVSIKMTAIVLMVLNSFVYWTCQFHFKGSYNSMLEPYLIFNGRSPHLYKNFDNSSPNNFQRAQSVFFLEKFEQPIHTILHKPSWDHRGCQEFSDPSLQTTALYQAFRQPIFVNNMMSNNSYMQHPHFNNKFIPPMNSPWINHDQQYYVILELYYQMKHEQVFPEYIWGHYPDGIQLSNPDELFIQILEKVKQYYDEVDKFLCQNRILSDRKEVRLNAFTYLLKIKPEYEDKIIKSGYSNDKSGNNKKSMGSLFDLNRAYYGLQSPLNQQILNK